MAKCSHTSIKTLLLGCCLPFARYFLKCCESSHFLLHDSQRRSRVTCTFNFVNRLTLQTVFWDNLRKWESVAYANVSSYRLQMWFLLNWHMNTVAACIFGLEFIQAIMRTRKCIRFLHIRWACTRKQPEWCHYRRFPKVIPSQIRVCHSLKLKFKYIAVHCNLFLIRLYILYYVVQISTYFASIVQGLNFCNYAELMI